MNALLMGGFCDSLAFCFVLFFLQRRLGEGERSGEKIVMSRYYSKRIDVVRMSLLVWELS